MRGLFTVSGASRSPSGGLCGGLVNANSQKEGKLNDSIRNITVPYKNDSNLQIDIVT